MSEERSQFLRLILKYSFMVALALIVLVALWYRLGVIDNYIVPTYGNTMYHVGIERETIATQYYPQYELSYGGGFKHFYVPAYRMLISSMSVATGIDPMVMSGLMTITIALFVLLVMFILAYRLSNNLYIGLFAAFFFLVSPEITIFTMRPLPELLGLFMVPFTLYFVARKNWPLAVLGTVITALTHQMTLATLAGVLGLYMAFQFIRASAYYAKNKADRDRYMGPLREALWCLALILAACVTYGAWQTYSLGTPSLMGTAQLKNHEGNPVDLPLFLRTGVFVLPFFVIGLSFILTSLWDSLSGKKEAETAHVYGYRISIDTALLVFAWVISTLVLTFNNWINPYIESINTYTGSIVTLPTIPIFPIFMDRFFTFFVQIAIIVAGFGVYALLRVIDLDVLKVEP